jgi:hypothetical protein
MAADTRHGAAAARSRPAQHDPVVFGCDTPPRRAVDLVVRDIAVLRLRALVAKARGDEAAYRDYRDRYRAMAHDFGFEGHMAWAEAMA